MADTREARHQRQAYVVAAYLAVMTTFIYADANTSARYGHEDLFAIVEFAGLALLHLATGFAIGRWWAPLLVVVPVLIAIPAGQPPWLYHEPGPPIWQALAVLAVPEALAVALGVFVRLLTSGPPFEDQAVGVRRAGAS